MADVDLLAGPGGETVGAGRPQPPADGPSRPSGRLGHPSEWPARHGGKLAVGTLLVVLGFIVLAPLLRLQARALESGGDAYRRMVDSPRFGDALTTTILLAIGSLVIALVLGTSLAWAADRLPPRLRWLSAIPMLPLVVPAVASIVGWTFLLSPQLGYINSMLRATPLFDHLTEGPVNVYSQTWIIIITGFSLTSFVYLFVFTALRSMSQDLSDAASVCRARPWREFRTVTLPLLRPSLVYAGGIVLLLALGQFTAPLLLGTREGVRVLTTEMYYAVQTYPADYGLGAAYGSPVMIVGLVALLIQRRLLRNQDRFVTVTGKSMRYSELSSRWASPLIVLYGLLALVLPLVALVLVGMSDYWTGDLAGPYSGDHFRELIGEARVRDSIATSLRTSFLALLIVLPLGFGAAVITLSKRQRGAVRAVTDTLINIPLAIPAALFGAAVLFTYVEPPIILFGTVWIIVIAYVTIIIPHSARLQLTALTSLSPELTEAAEVSGARPMRIWRTVTIPLIRRGLASAAALIMIILMQEFSASLFVRSVNTEVMGSTLHYYWENGTYSQVAVVALLMVLVTAVVGCIALAFGRERRFARR